MVDVRRALNESTSTKSLPTLAIPIVSTLLEVKPPRCRRPQVVVARRQRIFVVNVPVNLRENDALVLPACGLAQQAAQEVQSAIDRRLSLVQCSRRRHETAEENLLCGQEARLTAG